jgi:hypothetical protein
MKKIAVPSVILATVLSFFVVVSAIIVPATVDAVGGPGTTTVTKPDLNISFKLDNPLGSTKDLPSFLKKLLQAVILLLVPVVTIMFLYSGFLFVKAQGNSEKLDEAKRALLYTVIGAAIVLGAVGFSEAIKSTVSQF